MGRVGGIGEFLLCFVRTDVLATMAHSKLSWPTLTDAMTILEFCSTSLPIGLTFCFSAFTLQQGLLTLGRGSATSGVAV
ncbi:hypothetical protein A4A49_04917 [Nicotiana attenuata]|uniref:Uncharacterized protein n=1 Tax=Nicotiana attenuata TaxID=49451 RepID=A0A1J6IS47_NICAT|nr:hypothetical protein A4A49_04917 [Nicotiana attenuata]